MKVIQVRNLEIVINISKDVYEANAKYINETINYFLKKTNETGYFGFVNEINSEEKEHGKLTMLDWRLLKKKVIQIDSQKFIVEASMTEEDIKQILLMSSYNSSLFCSLVEEQGYFIKEHDDSVDIILNTDVEINKMSWKHFPKYKCYVALLNGELYYASECNADRSINKNDIQLLSFLPKEQESEYLYDINQIFGSNFKVDEFENDASCIKEFIPLPKIFINLETNEEINKEQLEKELEQNILFLRDIKSRKIIEVEHYLMDDSIGFKIFDSDIEVEEWTRNNLSSKKVLKSEFIDFLIDEERYEFDISERILELVEKTNVFK